MRNLTLLAALILPIAVQAQDLQAVLADTVQSHILPRFAQLADTSGTLKASSQADCSTDAPDLQAAYHDTFDAWISASHLRFGPSETDDRAFALAFWPDSKGFTPKALSGLIAREDDAVYFAEGFAETSIAGRGFFALEQVLFDPQLSVAGADNYRCALVRAIATDIKRNARAIDNDWQSYAGKMARPGPDGPYRSDDEAMQELFKALITGLEFTADTRLGRPMGTHDRPRPNRAEARRSERSLRHVELSLIALHDLATHLSTGHPRIADDLDAAFARAISRAQSLDDPAFAGVADPQGRIRVEALQQSINDIRAIASTELGPTLGISAGFNSLDGD